MKIYKKSKMLRTNFGIYSRTLLTKSKKKKYIKSMEYNKISSLRNLSQNCIQRGVKSSIRRLHKY